MKSLEMERLKKLKYPTRQDMRDLIALQGEIIITLEKKLTSDNSDYDEICKPGEHNLKGSFTFEQCNKCGEYVGVG
jgi:hypothetical protein